MMAKKSKKQQDDQFIELPEDRIDQIGEAETQESVEEKTQRKPSSPRKAKQAQVSEPKSPKEGPEKLPDKPAPSKEDLLADIRQELAGEEEIVEKKGFFGRFKDRLKNLSKAKPKAVETQTLSEGALEIEVQAEPQDEPQELVIAPKPKKRSSATKQEEKAIQEFFADLEALSDVLPDEILPEVVEPPEPRFEELKPDEKVKLPKLPIKSDVEADIDFEKVRELALQEYDVTQLEPTYKRKASLQEEVRKTVRESRPLERVLLFGVVALTAVVLLFSGIFIIVRSIPVPTPEPTVVVNLEDMVYPKQLNLPGGWGFNLGQGRVAEGKWSPRGAEWLIGTEISRWVALPWSLQLEAVLENLEVW